MTRRFPTWSLIQALTLVVAGREPGFSQNALPVDSDPQETINVRIYNYARLSPGMLAHAETQAANVFAKAGVKIVWLEYPLEAGVVASLAVSQPQRTGWEVALGILPQSMAERAPASHEALGFALPCFAGAPGCYAQVFYQRVEELARGGEVFVHRTHILGHAMAHEIGHLLLGDNSHAPAGIMRADWQREDLRYAARGMLLFTPEQAELIRTEVMARTAEQEQISRLAATK